MNTFKSYLHSFKLKKEFVQTFIVDLIFFLFVFLVFSKFSSYLQNKAVSLLGGKTPEQFQEMLTTVSPEQLLPVLSQLKSFLLFATVGFFCLAVITVLLYSLSQAIIWNHLSNHKLSKKTYWRWNALNLALILPVIGYGIIYFLVKLILGGIIKFIVTLNASFYVEHATVMDAILTITNGLISFVLMIFLLILILLVYYTFTEKYRVWASIGEGFHLLKVHWPKVWKGVLLMSLTAIILTGIFWPVRNLLESHQFWLTIVNLIVSLLFLAWARIYVLKNIIISR